MRLALGRIVLAAFGFTASVVMTKVRILFATAACVFFWRATEKYMEYREKYPRAPEVRNHTPRSPSDPPAP
jgi:hypothetical protein